MASTIDVLGLDSQDFGIESDDDIHVEDPPKYDAGLDNIIVVDNIPVVPQEKFQKLEMALRKVYGKIDCQLAVIKDDGFWIPVDPVTQKTLGYCFIEYNTRQEAELARDKINGYKFDRAHKFAVNMFNDFDRYMKVSNEWTRPESKPYTPGENLQHWLTDEKARDQFVICAGSDTEVFWNDARQLRPELVYKHACWTESVVQWSPLGTYLATLHRQGVALWGGTKFSRLMRFAHLQVERIDYSPSEKYLVTYGSHEPSDPCDAHAVVLNVFDVRTGKVMCHFEGSMDKFSFGAGGASGFSWPLLRWGGGKDDKYFAMIQKNVISVYETETFSLIDKKPLKVENVMDFSWSPADSILALFVPEVGGGNQPARVSLVHIPSKKELRQKSLFNVTDCKMYWQRNGDYLAVKVNRYSKTEKVTYTGFAIFRVRERDIPIEVLELENKNDEIIAFEWEPKGHRFAVIHGDSRLPDVSFYLMHSGSNAGQMSKLTTLKRKHANALFWSPGGSYVIIAGLGGFKGKLEFYNVSELETMTTDAHFMATGLEWDPTGRYVATSVTSVNEMENGFKIWSFTGKLLYHTLKDHLFQFSWRPRGPSILSHEKEEEITRNLKKYSKKYEAEDQVSSMLSSEQDCQKRRKLKDEWEGWVNDWRRQHREEEVERRRLRDGEDSDEEEQEEYEAEEVEVEESLLDASEEVLAFDLDRDYVWCRSLSVG